MPYKREGKCIKNKETGKDMGCSKTTEKAKAHLKALYASELKERIQSTVKKVINERVAQGDQQIQEGKLGSMLAGLALVASLIGYKASINSNPTMEKLNMALEKAEAKGDKEAISKIEDMITKQDVWLSTGQGEDQLPNLGNLNEKLKGGQKKLDANKDGKISGEDFKLLQKEGGDGRTENYMFFSNLKQMHRQIEFLMEINPQVIDMILQNGHDWADDHITEAKTNMDQVFDFIMNEIK